MFRHVILGIAVLGTLTVGVGSASALTPEQFCENKRALGGLTRGIGRCIANQIAKQQKPQSITQPVTPIKGGEGGRNRRQ